MITMPPIPPRRHEEVKRYDLRKFSDFVNSSDEAFRRSLSSGFYIDDVALFKQNFDLFLKMLSTNWFKTVSCHDYECLRFIENELRDCVGVQLVLADDFQNRDRSYINIDEFEKTGILIPMTYSTWDVQSSKDIPVAAYYSNFGNYQPMGIAQFPKVSREFLSKLNDVIGEVATQWKGYTDLDKVILISNYLQDRVQFVADNNISEGQKGIYVTDSNGIAVNRNVHSPATVLFQQFGVCEGIANATTLLLNNPIVNVNARSVFGSSHVWNIVFVDGQFYFTDNTWSITRNESQYPESLKAKDFTSEYLLLGSKKMEELGHHEAVTILPSFSGEDYPRKKIEERQKVLSKQFRFHNYSQPIFESHLKNND